MTLRYPRARRGFWGAGETTARGKGIVEHKALSHSGLAEMRFGLAFQRDGFVPQRRRLWDGCPTRQKWRCGVVDTRVATAWRGAIGGPCAYFGKVASATNPVSRAR